MHLYIFVNWNQQVWPKYNFSVSFQKLGKTFIDLSHDVDDCVFQSIKMTKMWLTWSRVNSWTLNQMLWLLSEVNGCEETTGAESCGETVRPDVLHWSEIIIPSLFEVHCCCTICCCKWAYFIHMPRCVPPGVLQHGSTVAVCVVLLLPLLLWCCYPSLSVFCIFCSVYGLWGLKSFKCLSPMLKPVWELIENTAQCSELFRVARHRLWNARSLNRWARCHKYGTIVLLICWWHSCFTSPQTTEASHNSLVALWPATSSIEMKINHDWFNSSHYLQGGRFACVLSCVMNLDAIFDCVSMFGSLLNIDGKYSFFFFYEVLKSLDLIHYLSETLR